MARITIEQGHWPRNRGATGTWREQELTRAVGQRLRDALVARGHVVRLIGADDPMPQGDVFVSLHGDSGNATVAGRGRSTRRGASVGYPGTSRLAAAWKRHHAARGYPGGFLADNYTAGLRGYYRWSATRAYPYRFLAELGTLTHAGDESWLFANLGLVVHGLVDAVGEVVGHPRPLPAPAPPAPTPLPSEEDDMPLAYCDVIEVGTDVYLVLHATQTARKVAAADRDYYRNLARSSANPQYAGPYQWTGERIGRYPLDEHSA